MIPMFGNQRIGRIVKAGGLHMCRGGGPNSALDDRRFTSTKTAKKGSLRLKKAQSGSTINFVLSASEHDLGHLPGLVAAPVPNRCKFVPGFKYDVYQWSNIPIFGNESIGRIVKAGGRHMCRTTVRNLRATISQKCEAVPRRARI